MVSIKKIIAGTYGNPALFIHQPHQKDILNIIYATPEAEPFAKTGGLGEVPKGLLIALAELGHNVSLVMPKHTGSTDQAIRLGLPITYEDSWAKMQLDIPGKRLVADIFKTYLPPVSFGVKTFLVDSSNYDFFGDKPYRNIYSHPDDSVRFYFYNLVTAAMVPEVPHNLIVHTNDWQTAYIHTLLRTKYLHKTIPTLHTIHNLKYYSEIRLHDFYLMTGLTEAAYPGLYSEAGIKRAFTDYANPTWAALNMADTVTTVSKKYVHETLTPLYGEGFQHLLQQRNENGSYTGIVNGVSQEWYPPFDHTNFVAEKAVKKREVQQAFGLKEDPNAFLIMMAARLDDQKGFELVTTILELLYTQKHINFQFVVTADVSPNRGNEILDAFRNLIHHSSIGNRIGIIPRYNEALTRTNYAGADVSLIPSKFEPCGLVSPISIVNGTVPIGRAVGGIADIIRHGQNGFLFSGDWYTIPGDSNFYNLTRNLLRAIDEAHQLFLNKDRWHSFIKGLMKEDLSWKNAAREYVELYRLTLDRFGSQGPYRAYGYFG